MSTFRQKVQATTNWVKPDPEDLVEPPKKSLLGSMMRAAPAATSAGNAARSAHRRKAPPVTAHRLFPAFAALWFAALFGLGGLAISGAALGSLVMMAGLPALVPAAAPPLGFTAHVLVAFGLTFVGAALGLVLGLRLRPAGAVQPWAAPAVAPVNVSAIASGAGDAEADYKVRARDAHPDAPPRRPLVLTEAFADPVSEGLAAEPAQPQTELAQTELLRQKPAPAAQDGAPESSIWIPEFIPGGAGAVQPLDLAVLDLEVPVEEPVFAQVFVSAPEPEALESEAQEPDILELATVDENAFHAEPTDSIAPDAPVEAATEVVPVTPALIAATPQLPIGFAATQPDAAEGAWSPVARAPLESLGLVQLIERLALSMAAHKAAGEAVEEEAVEVAAEEAIEEPVGGAIDEVAVEVASAAPEAEPELEVEPYAEPEFEPGPFSKPQVDQLAADAAAGQAVPPAGSAREAILHRLGALAAGEPQAAADGPPPFSRPANAITSAPTEAVAVLRPAGPSADPAPPGAVLAADADEALRSALATLQRMTARG